MFASRGLWDTGSPGPRTAGRKESCDSWLGVSSAGLPSKEMARPSQSDEHPALPARIQDLDYKAHLLQIDLIGRHLDIESLFYSCDAGAWQTQDVFIVKHRRCHEEHPFFSPSTSLSSEFNFMADSPLAQQPKSHASESLRHGSMSGHCTLHISSDDYCCCCCCCYFCC